MNHLKEIILEEDYFRRLLESSLLNWSEDISEQFDFSICDAWNMVAKESWNFNELATLLDGNRHLTHYREKIEEMMIIHIRSF